MLNNNKIFYQFGSWTYDKEEVLINIIELNNFIQYLGLFKIG